VTDTNANTTIISDWHMGDIARLIYLQGVDRHKKTVHQIMQNAFPWSSFQLDFISEVVGGVHSLHIFSFTLPLQNFFRLGNHFGMFISFLFLWERGGNKQKSLAFYKNEVKGKILGCSFISGNFKNKSCNTVTHQSVGMKSGKYRLQM